MDRRHVIDVEAAIQWYGRYMISLRNERDATDGVTIPIHKGPNYCGQRIRGVVVIDRVLLTRTRHRIGCINHSKEYVISVYCPLPICTEQTTAINTHLCIIQASKRNITVDNALDNTRDVVLIICIKRKRAVRAQGRSSLWRC